MLTLNLTKENSDYLKRIDFSDSQKQFIVDTHLASMSDVCIQSRMSWWDLQNIIVVTKALQRLPVKNIYLEVPYFLGARSDRLFENGSTHYLKDIICPIINSLNFKSVSVLDPHSFVLEACLNNMKELNIYSFYDWFVETSEITTKDKRKMFLISPDYGAIKRVNGFAKQYTFQKVLNCGKVRDIQTGKIVETHIPILDFGGNKCIILDDLVDGGSTFIELGKQLKERNAGEIILVVTHGIFSKGFNELFKYIDKIYTTNSVADFNYNNLFQYKII